MIISQLIPSEFSIYVEPCCDNNYYGPCFSLCPRFGEYQLEFKKSSVWSDHQNITKFVLNEISNAINFTVGQ